MKLTGGTDWPGGWTQQIGQRVARRRRDLGISQTGLSERCAELGHPIPRNTVVGLETGRRETLTLGELVIIGAALEVAPALLAFPANEFVQYLPGERVTSYEAMEAFTGISPQPATWAETLGRLLTDDEGTALLNTVKVMRKVGA